MKVTSILMFSVPFLLAGCALQAPQQQVNSNGVIHWSSGVEESVHIAPTNEHLVFTSPSFMNQDLVIYSRIVGAGTENCEYYVNEPSPHVRLTLCDDGNIELMNKGRTINVGKLTVFES